MQTVFIYSLHCPITGDLRYIGKTNNLRSRLSVHLADKGNNHRTNWIRSLLAVGLVPIIETVDEVLEEFWKPVEAAYIQFFREEGCDLVNGTNGGDDPPLSKKGHCLGKKNSEETRAKISISKLGKKRSPETCKKMSLGNMGQKPWNLGKTPSSETRVKISLSLMGNRPWNAGIPCSVETRAKISATKKGKNICL